MDFKSPWPPQFTVAAIVPEALDKMTEQKFDILLCDLNIQGDGDGYQVNRAMQQVNPSCVNVVLTGYPSIGSAIEGIHLGISDYLIKPGYTGCPIS